MEAPESYRPGVGSVVHYLWIVKPWASRLNLGFLTYNMRVVLTVVSSLGC